MNLEEAVKGTRHGAYAAFFSVGVTSLFVGLAILNDAQGDFAYWNDPLYVVDIVFMLLCGIGMLRKSRAAAIVMLLYWVLAKVYIASGTDNVAGAIIGVFYAYFFVQAVRGSFVYHKLKKAEDPNYRAAPKWAYYVGIPAVVLFIILSALGLLSIMQVLPSTEVLAGEDVREADRELLITNNVLFADEQIEYLYSYGLASVAEGGSVLTDRAAIVYYLDEEGVLNVHELRFEQIDSIELLEEGGVFTDSVYLLQSTADDSWIMLELSTELGGDQKFIEALRKKVEHAKKSVYTEPPQDEGP